MAIHTKYILFCTLLLSVQHVFQFTNGYRILAVFPHPGKSHSLMYQDYLFEMARRGHNLTVISPFPQRNKDVPPGYREIDVSSLFAHLDMGDQGVDFISLPGIVTETQLECMEKIAWIGEVFCEMIPQIPEVKHLLANSQPGDFDLYLTEIFNCDCFLAIARKLQLPVVAFTTSVYLSWTAARIGLPDNPAYIPVTLSGFDPRDGFQQRLLNTWSYVAQHVVYNWISESRSYEAAQRHIGDPELPPLWQLAKNTTLVFHNSHFSFTGVRPLVPGAIEVAGMHLKPPKMLHEDIQEFLDGAEHGAIYFSMGSMIRAETFPDEKRDAFLQAFAELPQRVLWKWEGDNLPGQPKNVKVGKWLPQFDILNHPKIRVFLAHGGLLGTIETVHCGIPMVAIPMYGDQSTNVKLVETAGMAIKLNYHDITKDNVLKALRTILDDPSYTENAKRVSRIFRDRPMSPMDTAIYWTEYVIRHHGAPHMRTAGADLPLYQYLLLDVIATILAVVFIVAFLMYLMLKKLFRLLCARKQKQKRE